MEFKFANVSAVLRELGLPYVLGYQPRGNIQGALRPAVKRFLASDTELARLLEEMAAPDLPPGVELAEVDPPVMASPGTTGRGRTSMGVDYPERQARNRDLDRRSRRSRRSQAPPGPIAYRQHGQATVQITAST